MLIEPDDDQMLLLDLLDCMRAEQHSEFIQRACIDACMAVAGNALADGYSRSWGGLPPVEASPASLTDEFLKTCMPAVPCNYFDDFGFEDAYADRAASRLSFSRMRVVLASSAGDERHAARWAIELSECAREVAPDFMASKAIAVDPSDPDEQFVDVQRVCGFIVQWRENFLQALAKANDKPRR